jgi:uncharacterized membrane protein YoaK (UPF0700 family)
MKSMITMLMGVAMIVAGVAMATIIKRADPNNLINDGLAIAQVVLLGGLGASILDAGWRDFRLTQSRKK